MALPPNVPSRNFFSPVLEDSLLVETTSAKVGDYVPLEEGAPYPKPGHSAAQAALFEGHYLLNQRALPGDDQFVQRVFSTDPVRQDTYAYALEYSGDSASHRIYVRSYLERRDQYVERTRGSTLTGIFGVRVTAVGANYTTATVAASGGTGSGWTGSVVLGNDGTVRRVVTETEGSYTVAPTLTISGDGAGATAVALLQSTSAILVKEDAKPAGEPWGDMWLRVMRVYEVLPGPWIPFTRYDDDLGPIQGRRRAVLNSGQEASLTATGKTTYEGREGSSIVSWEIEEAWSDGTGGAGNPAYPINVTNFYEPLRGEVEISTQLVTDLTSEGSLTHNAGVITEIRYESYNEFLRKKIIETFTLGDEIYTPGYENETGAATRTYKKTVLLTTALPALGSTYAGSYIVIDAAIQEESDLWGIMVIETMVVPGSRVEDDSIGFQFPAIFDFVSGWVLPDESTGGTRWPFQPPYPGDAADCNYQLEAHRTASKPAETTYTYTNGDPGAMPDTFMVETPARASRVFPIGANTIHDAINVTQVDGADTQTVEKFAASTPSTYTKGSTLTIRASSRRWKGPIYEKRVTTIEE